MTLTEGERDASPGLCASLLRAIFQRRFDRSPKPVLHWRVPSERSAANDHLQSNILASPVYCVADISLDRMNTPAQSEAVSWLTHVGSAATVLGPSRGHVPNLCEYRIACVHLAPWSMWLFGAVTGMPPEVESSGEKNGMSKFNLALQVSVRQVLSFSGMPQLDSGDDSNHGFQLAKPVAVRIRETDEPVWPDSVHRILELSAESLHLNFEVRAEFIHGYGGKHALKRFEGGLNVRR